MPKKKKGAQPEKVDKLTAAQAAAPAPPTVKEITPEKKKQIQEIETQLKNVEKIKNKLDIDLELGDITKEEFESKKGILEDKKKALSKKIEDLKK